MKYTVRVAGNKRVALRQAGESEVHPEDCTCRKCRRARAARSRRAKPRYGQRPGPDLEVSIDG